MKCARALSPKLYKTAIAVGWSYGHSASGYREGDVDSCSGSGNDSESTAELGARDGRSMSEDARGTRSPTGMGRGARLSPGYL